MAIPGDCEALIPYSFLFCFAFVHLIRIAFLESLHVCLVGYETGYILLLARASHGWSVRGNLYLVTFFSPIYFTLFRTYRSLFYLTVRS